MIWRGTRNEEDMEEYRRIKRVVKRMYKRLGRE